MTAWQWLVQQAILGVERSNFQVVNAGKQLAMDDAGLRKLLERVTEVDSSTQFLHTAAIFNQLRCAGQKPASLSPLVTLAACPAEILLPAGETANILLQQLAAEDNPRLLGVWLEYAAAAHCHLPYELLPRLLELALTHCDLADQLAPCLGERGRWLLALHPIWQVDAAQPVTENDWQVGNIQRRTTFCALCARLPQSVGVSYWWRPGNKRRLKSGSCCSLCWKPT